ncbi:hypothetical protein M0813_04578 [Anaeramoeba flamelloides]|uniref:Uncharacterized protein n=1 Tax=Anaeramoeba flamelloides TaxID=1746091 RepID=A0ABQ8XL49_9EUKA|nr:hypothetical protein M0813_04578 [Anaeramoeba flamelloides]
MTNFEFFVNQKILDPSNASNTKPFPHNANPIFVDSKNWVLTETIKTKKHWRRSTQKIIFFALGMDNSVQNPIQASTVIKVMEEKPNQGIVTRTQANKRTKEKEKRVKTKAKTTYAEIAFNCGENGILLETQS